jgi:N-acetylneuraminic acid mutarotase
MKNLTANLKDEETPPPRQDHAAVIYNNALYIYGGLGLDNKIYDDMWKYDFSSNAWTEIRTEAQQKKYDKKRQKELEKEGNNEKNNENIEEEDELDDDEEIVDIRPKGRSGHCMVVVGDEFYIFGGKTGLIKESNDIWKFIPERNDYECVHETLLEQFTKEELSKISAENKKDEKKFRWLTRSDVEKRTNPSFNSYKAGNDADKNKKKNKKELDKKNNQGTTNVKMVKMDKNKKATKKNRKKIR